MYKLGTPKHSLNQSCLRMGWEKRRDSTLNVLRELNIAIPSREL